MESYLVGDSIRFDFALENSLGDLVDAETDGLTLKVQAGSAGAVVDLTDQIVRDSLGTYHCDFDLTIATEPTDPYKYTWRSTGAVKAVAGGRFMTLEITP